MRAVVTGSGSTTFKQSQGNFSIFSISKSLILFYKCLFCPTYTLSPYIGFRKQFFLECFRVQINRNRNKIIFLNFLDQIIATMLTILKGKQTLEAIQLIMKMENHDIKTSEQ